MEHRSCEISFLFFDESACVLHKDHPADIMYLDCYNTLDLVLCDKVT